MFIFHRYACNLDKKKWNEAGKDLPPRVRARRSPHQHEHEKLPRVKGQPADGPLNSVDEFLHYHFEKGESGRVSFIVLFVRDLRRFIFDQTYVTSLCIQFWQTYILTCVERTSPYLWEWCLAGSSPDVMIKYEKECTAYWLLPSTRSGNSGIHARLALVAMVCNDFRPRFYTNDETCGSRTGLDQEQDTIF
jgi:hypothetical protein